MSARTPGRTAVWWALGLLLIGAAFALRLWTLGAESIWHDEAWSIRAFRGPFTTPDDNTPYLYYLSGHLLWRLGAGESALALRYVSVLIGTLTVALSLRLGRAWIGPLGGIVAGLMVAVSPLLWEYSQEVRAYVAVPLLALALVAAADAILRYERGERVPPRAWGLAFAAQVAALYTHNLSVPLIVWLNAALGLAWLARRDWRKMATWAGLETALIVAYLPWLFTQSPSGTPLNTPPQPGLALIRDIWAAYFLPVPAQLEAGLARAEVALPLLGLALLALGGAAAVALLGWRQPWSALARRGWLLLTHAVLVPAFSIALMLAARIDFHPRYLIAALPGTLLLAALPLALWRDRLRPAAWGAALSLLALLLAVLSLGDIRRTPAYQHDDFRALAEYYASLPPDAVILIPFDAERALQDYYLPRLDAAAQVVNLPLYSDEAAALAVINDLVQPGRSRHVELLTWFQLPADVRGMVPCLLAAGSQAVGPPQPFFGLSTQRFELTETVMLTPLLPQPRFDGVTHLETAAGAGPVAACVRSRWALDTATPLDLAAAVALRDPIGGELTRVDASIARDDNAPTSDWDAGDSGASYALLTPPPGTPMESYPVTLSVYSAAQPSGFDVLDAAGAPAGKVAQFDDRVMVAGPPLQAIESTLDAASRTRFAAGQAVALRLSIAEADHGASLRLQGADWSLLLHDALPGGRITWVRFVVPPGQAGTADLMLGDQVLATFEVSDVPRQFTAPDFAVPVAVAWPGIGVLLGADAPQAVSLAHGPPQVTLIWQAEGAAPVSYTVFVQLISPEGAVIAQSDRPPASGDRPTTGWAAGEIIVDAHTLTINLSDYTGEARLVAGFYDAVDGFRRATTTDGADFALILGEVTVSP